MKVNVYSVAGKSLKKVDLPSQFKVPLRPDLIRKSVTTARANRRQSYGPAPMAGMRHAVEQWGKGRGTARVMRLKGSRRAAQSPPAVGGRRAHPPRPDKDWSKRMNKKERLFARRSALSAVSSADLVKARGHRFSEKLTLPIVVEDKLEKLSKASEAMTFFEKIGISDDVVRAREGRHIRAGRGKMRGRRYKRPKGILIITTGPSLKAACNIPGVDIVPANRVSVEDLAPGGDPGRLTVITESALKEVSSWK